MGAFLSLYSQSFPPKSLFSVDDIPDLTERVVIVTGANTGLGKETAKALLAHNAKVYIAARSQQKAEDAIRELKEQTGKEALFLKLDLSDLVSVKSSAEEFMSKEKELHVLFNNAGVMLPPLEQLTVQGYDLTIGTNVLGHFYFTSLLLPALKAGANSSPDRKSRIVTTSSSAAYEPGGNLDFNVLTDGPARQKTTLFRLYAYSKLGNILITKELARRYGDQGIVSTSCNPGNIKTDISRNFGFILNAIVQPFFYPASQGALTQLWAGTSLEALELNGQYLIPWARRASVVPPGSDDDKLAADLWAWCEEQCAKIHD